MHKKRLAPGAAIITTKKAPITKTLKKQSQLKKKFRRDTSSSSEVSELPVYKDSDDEKEFCEELRNESKEIYSAGENRIIDVNKWVLVQYAAKKSVKHYVGKVIENTNADDWPIRFLRFRKNKFIWPAV